jgi:hypothetical protein
MLSTFCVIEAELSESKLPVILKGSYCFNAHSLLHNLSHFHTEEDTEYQNDAVS